MGYTEEQRIADHVAGMNATSEVGQQQREATSPVLQFQSQTMAGIRSPRPQQRGTGT